MTRIGPLLALTLALLTLLRQDAEPAQHGSAVLLAVLAVGHWQPERGWRLRAWLLRALLLVLLLVMASYLLPEYWLSIGHWNAWLSALPGDIDYRWRPPALMTLALLLLAASLQLNLRLALGAPLLLTLSGLALLTQALDQLWATSIWVLDHAASPSLLAAAGCLLAVQASLLIQRRREQLPGLRRPLLAGLAPGLVALLFWHQQTTLEDRRQYHASAAQSRALAEDFERENADHLAAMRRFVSFWELYDAPPSEAAWARQASRYHQDYRYFLNIAFILPSSEIIRVFPLAGNENALGARLFDDQPAGRPALSEALIHGREGSTGAIDLLQGVPGIIHYLPVRSSNGNEILGATAMVVSLPALLDTLFDGIDTRAQALRLYAGEQLLGEVGRLDDRVNWRHRFSIDVGGQPLLLDALPGRSALLMQRARLPEVGLLMGLTFAYLLYLVLFAYQRLAGQHRAAHHTNQELRREVQARSILQREVEWMARHDELTELPNRRLFMETLDANAERRPLSVLICDVDHFKRINDHLGHLAGDRYLRHIGEVGREVIGEQGLFARYGGEEFVACLPGSDAKQAEQLAERLRQAIHQADLLHHDGQRLSVSIGIATQVQGALDIGQLMQVADEALYGAKAGGRNRVVSGRPLTLSDGTCDPLSTR
ncbi:sensor domain-containing diguanylate cyclase [Franzmannia qiaohouensis]|uniref:diguanylate cyclase n=1 Tax=Franzmannia qiaohouensis TaxID=1329370 RepID=A0ABU1HD27_9GAMM|nr:sensor domain-containing diguanylate cyclase [Halomonas qiaohouensis]MDR5904729.1 sensor domain-containing diguanylate cyclase [Halomonas qiaohouensis]